MDGILNLWKPPGITSHDVVAYIRRLTGQRRVGHAGTLDPMAEGVLVVGIGQGTRLLEYLMTGTKEYCARIHLGITTDTDDADGRIIAMKEVRRYRRPTIEQVLQSLVGRQEQKPPAYTALKVAGEPAYRRARRGEAVERAARQVEVEAIHLIAWNHPHIVCHVTCSKGTYIRSLARDIGERLGCGAHLCGLVRVRSGIFTIEDAAPLPLLAHALAEGYVHQLLYPLDVAVQDRPAVILADAEADRLRQGKKVCLAATASAEARQQQPWRAYNAKGELIALMITSGNDGSWHADKVFAPSAAMT